MISISFSIRLGVGGGGWGMGVAIHRPASIYNLKNNLGTLRRKIVYSNLFMILDVFLCLQ